MMDVDTKLAEMGLTLPPVPRPIAAYVTAVRTGNLLFLSGQLPLRDGALMASGPVKSVEVGHAAARQCALNALAILKDQIGGDWSKLVRVVRLAAFVQCADGFGDQPKVANGASELLVTLLGEAGRHVRTAVGVNALPLDAMIEIEFVFEVR